MKRTIIFFGSLFLGGLALASYILMLFWNMFLVGATGANAVSYWQSVFGLVAFSFLMFASWWAKQFMSFMIITVNMMLAKRKFKKATNDAEQLLKHFSMFDKNGLRR